MLICRAGRYEVDGYVYNAADEPKVLMTGKWNQSMSYQPCDLEGEPLPDTQMTEVSLLEVCSHTNLKFWIVSINQNHIQILGTTAIHGNE